MEPKSVGFLEAFKLYFSNYTNFSGRSRRSEYFNAVLAVNCITSVCSAIPVLAAIWALVTLVPGIALVVRRLHDVGRSGWWYLIMLIPLVGTIIMLIWLCTDSDNDNQWGPNPKKASAPVLPPVPHQESPQQTSVLSPEPYASPTSYAPSAAKQAVMTLSLCSGSMAGMAFTCNSGNYVVLGRAPSKCDIVLHQSYSLVSGVHCQIACYDNYVTVTDLGSTNGTFVNGTALVPQQPFTAYNGAMIYLANSNCAFRMLLS